MKKPAVYVTDEAAMKAALDGFHPRMQRRVSAATAAGAAYSASRQLTDVMEIAKKHWKDITITVSPTWNRQPKVGAYRYRATAIEVELRYRVGKGWYISDIYTTTARNDNRENNRDWFLAVPPELIKTETILERLGISRTA